MPQKEIKKDEAKQNIESFFKDLESKLCDEDSSKSTISKLFRDHGFDSIEKLIDAKDLLTKDDLKDIGINKVYNQLTILSAIQNLSNTSSKSPIQQAIDRDNRNKHENKDDFALFYDKNKFQIIERDPHEEKREKEKYIKLNHMMKKMIEKYPFPFVASRTDEDRLSLFKNALDFKLIGSKPVDLDYNINHQVFKLQHEFRVKLYECFENNQDDFPFEWQFLNAQISYRINQYSFNKKIPKFVKEAYCFKDYWKDAEAIWKHSALVRKLDSVEEWKLLKPWVDLRGDCDSYGHEFAFGLIKYRVRRNPHYYMLEIVLPLFLMVTCVFHVFFPGIFCILHHFVNLK